MEHRGHRPPIINGLSVDVEDYFQVQALESVYPRDCWDACPSRVERNTGVLLDLFAQAGVKATFFTLGWVAARRPALVRRIAAEGHEIASHGLRHERVDRQTPKAFRADVRRTRRLLEDVSGTPVVGYRAATFSMGPRTPWAWRILEEEGHAYSSSIHPVAHDNYGAPDAPRGPHRPEGADALVEIPISTVRLFGRNISCGGGGYFRLAPYRLFRSALARVNGVEGRPSVFYLHPWEIDPDQPRPAGAPLKSRVRHYLNLSKTEGRLSRLVRDFSWDRIDRAFGVGAAAGARVPAAG